MPRRRTGTQKKNCVTNTTPIPLFGEMSAINTSHRGARLQLLVVPPDAWNPTEWIESDDSTIYDEPHVYYCRAEEQIDRSRLRLSVRPFFVIF